MLLLSLCSYFMWLVIFVAFTLFVLVAVAATRMSLLVKDKHPDYSKDENTDRCKQMINCAALNSKVIMIRLNTNRFIKIVMMVCMYLYMMIYETEVLYEKS